MNDLENQRETVPASHTPGEWGTDGEYVFAKTSHNIIGIAAMLAWVEPQERAANARMFAAAPMLFAELKTADRLLTQVASVLADERLENYIPCGLKHTVMDWLRSNSSGRALNKAEWWG